MISTLELLIWKGFSDFYFAHYFIFLTTEQTKPLKIRTKVLNISIGNF